MIELVLLLEREREGSERTREREKRVRGEKKTMCWREREERVEVDDDDDDDDDVAFFLCSFDCINSSGFKRLACAIPAPICPAPTTPSMRGRSFEAAVVIARPGTRQKRKVRWRKSF